MRSGGCLVHLGAEDESRSLCTPVPAIPVVRVATANSEAVVLWAVFGIVAIRGAADIRPAKARGAGLLPACAQRGSALCSVFLPWAAKRFLSGIKKHLPALLGVLGERGEFVGYIPMGAEHPHLPEHHPP